jgi:putative nucleotidyltransferase with HDIG domain
MRVFQVGHPRINQRDYFQVKKTMAKNKSMKQPKVIRMPLRFKITIPYLFLAMVLSIGVGFLATKIIFDTIDERFTNQLYEAGKLASDYVKNEENRLLETLRALSHTQGVAEAVEQGDGENLRDLTFGSVVNNQEEAVEFLDTQGNLVLSMRHKKGGKLEEYNFSKGGSVFNQWDIVKNVLAAKTDSMGDKYSAYIHTGWGDYFYVSGPIHDNNDKFVGVILVGKTLTTLVRQVRENTLAQVTLYSFGGQVLASTFTNPITLDPTTEQAVLVNQDTSSYRRNVSRRDVSMGELNYGEILGPWEARQGLDMGVIGSALVKNVLVTASVPTRLEILLLITFTVFIILIVGFNLASLITQPLLTLVNASQEVAAGHLQVQVPDNSGDEIAVLAKSFNQMVQNMYRSKQDLVEAYDSTLEGWSKALELRDKETQGHTRRVTDLTVALARKLGVDEDHIAHLRRGAMLHDIGKMGISDNILLKPGPLSDEEWVIMHKHPQYAFDILKDIEYLQPALEIPYNHHEWWDGTGYPCGLRETQIPLGARLFAIIDTWDALRSDRPYHRRISEEEAMRLIRQEAGTHFDPELVEFFFQHLSESN